MNPDESYSVHRSHNVSESQSMLDTRMSNSLHSSRRPKPSKNQGTSMKDSEEKSQTLDKSVK